MKLDIKTHRTRLGYSRKKLANQLGINEGSLTTYEAGRVPPLKTILKMCDEFGVNLNDFIGRSDWKDVKSLPPNPEGNCAICIWVCAENTAARVMLEAIYKDGIFKHEGKDITDYVTHWQYLPTKP